MKWNITHLIGLSLLVVVTACPSNNGSTYDGKNGVKVFYHKHSRVVKARINYKNKLADGLYQSYYSSGKLQSEVYYQKGRRHGKSTHYYENGQVKSVDYFKEDHQDSTSVVYDSDGKLKSECFYLAGKYHNRFAVYYPDGKLKQELHYKNGLRDGEQKYFYPNGNLKMIAYYREGFPGIGLKEYTTSGKLLDPGVGFQIEEVNQLALKSQYIYRVRLSKSSADDQVYLGSLLAGKYMHPSMYPLRKKNGYFEHVYNVPKYATYMEAVSVIVKTKSASGEDLVLTRKLNVALNNFY